MRIVLIDDHELMVDSLYYLLKQEKELDIIGKFTEAQKAIDAIEELKPEIILSDYQMPVLNGIDVIHAVKKKKLPSKVIILTLVDDYKTLTAIRLNGADGIIQKNASVEELLTCIRTVSQGETYYKIQENSENAEGINKTFYADISENEEIEVSITERELEVMKLISLDFTNAQIADKLFISERTVETHRKNIFKKLHINTALGLMRFMIKNRLL